MNATEYFEKKLKPLVDANPEVFKDLNISNQSIALKVEGPTGGDWTLQFDATGRMKLVTGVPSGTNSTIQSNEKTLGGLLDGSVNVAFALMMRKIKVAGDVGLAKEVGLALKRFGDA